MAIPFVLKKYSVEIDGRQYPGICETVTLPKLTLVTEDWRGSSQDTGIKIDQGIEMLELSFSMKEFDANLITTFGVAQGNTVPFVFRAPLVGDGNAVQPFRVETRGMVTELDFGDLKAGESGLMKCTVHCRTYGLFRNNRELVFIDTLNVIRRINGEDVLVQHRTAMGI